MFLGSHFSQQPIDNSHKIYERMTLSNRATSTSYKNKHVDPPTVLLDQELLVKAFGKRYPKFVSCVNIGKSEESKEKLLEKIEQFFGADIENSLLVYSGPAEELSGSLYFEFRNEEGELENYVISYKELIDLWKRRHHNQKHLLLVLDSSYSENWIQSLVKYGDPSVSIQGSCRMFDRATEDRKIGSYFIYNWSKIIASLKYETINPPSKNHQIPVFYGNFFYIEMFYGLQMKFESWNDMRKALNSSHFGDWPRMAKKENPYIQQLETKKLDGSTDKINAQIRSYQTSSKNYHGQKLVNTNPNSNQRNEVHVCDKPDFATVDPLTARQTPVPPADENFRLSKSFIQPMDEEQIMRNSSVNKSVLMRSQSLDKSMDESLPANMLATDFVLEEGKFLGDYDRKGIKNGFGVLLDEEDRIIFQGQFKNDAKHGIGAVFSYIPDRVKVFEGRYRANLKNGHGQVFNADRICVYDGHFENDLRNGEGSEFYEDGPLKFEGSYKNDLRDGEGVEYYPNGLVKSRGNWREGVLDGPGCSYYYQSGPLEYRGEYRYGRRTGTGKLYRENGELRYQGDLVNGEIHGQGIMWDAETNKATEGFWEHGNYVDDSDSEAESEEADEHKDYKEENRRQRFASGYKLEQMKESEESEGEDEHVQGQNDSHDGHPQQSNKKTEEQEEQLNNAAVLQEIDGRFGEEVKQKNEDQKTPETAVFTAAQNESSNDAELPHKTSKTSKKSKVKIVEPQASNFESDAPIVQESNLITTPAGERFRRTTEKAQNAAAESPVATDQETGDEKAQKNGRFTIPKLQPYQEELIEAATAKIVRPTAKNEIVNPGNIYQAIKIDSTFKATPSRLSKIQISSDQPGVADPIANGLVLRRKSQLIVGEKPEVRAEVLKNSRVQIDSFTNSQPLNLQRARGNSTEKSAVASVQIQSSKVTLPMLQSSKIAGNQLGVPNINENLILSQMIIPNSEASVRIVEKDEKAMKLRFQSRQDIKLKDIKPGEVQEQLRKGLPLEDNTLPPRHTLSLAKTFQKEILNPDLTASLKKSGVQS